MLKKLLPFLLLTLQLFGETLFLSIGANPARLNPLLATDSASAEVAEWMFNALVTYDKNGSVVPELAEKYYFLNDKTLVFELKKALKWSDGAPFSAEDVVFTYKTITSPKIFTPYADDFRKVESVTAVGPYKVVVKYKEPFFKAVEVWMMSIVPKHILEKESDIMTCGFNNAPIGTGRYILKKFELSHDILLARNKEYFLGAPKIDDVVFRFLPDSGTSFMTLKSNKLDIGGLTPLQLERQLDKEFKERFNIIEQPSKSYTYMGFNLKTKKFSDPRVRQALSLSIDRQELIDILFFGHATISTGPFMPGTFAFNPDVPAVKQDIKKAKQLLKEAGYDDAHPLSFELATNSNNPTRVYTAVILQRQFQQIGVKVKIRTLEWQAFLNTVVDSGKFDALLLGWSMGLMPDAYSIWHSGGIKKGGFNFVGYKNPKVDALIDEAERTVDKKLLSRRFQELHKLIASDNPYLFLYIPNSITAVNKKISPIEPSIIGILHNQHKWIKVE